MNFEKEMNEYSAVILAEKGNDIPVFSETKSPHSKFAHFIFTDGEKLEGKVYELYAYQVGTVVAHLSDQIPVEKIYTKQLSEQGKEVLDKLGISYEYEELIPLAKSSKNREVDCPLEKSLLGLSHGEALQSLRERFGDTAEGNSCKV